MIAARKRNRLLPLIQGVLLVSFASAAHAETLSHQQAASTSKAKAVHYIENIPEDRKKNKQALKSMDIQVDEVKAQPVIEPPPLELKGVRG